VVDALWSRAVTAQFATYRPNVQAVPGTMSFRGVPVQVQSNGDNGLYDRTLDNSIAADVLVHLNAAQLVPKLRGLLDEVEAAYGKKNPNGDGTQDVWMYMPSQESMKNAAKILMAYKSKEMVPVLYRIATGPILQKSSGMQGRTQFYWSNRTWAMAALLQSTGQDPADWNLKVQANLSGMWTFPTEGDETATMAKLKDWWGKEHEKWGGVEDKRVIEPDAAPAEGRVKVMPLMR
jgi:hypothetical protein